MSKLPVRVADCRPVAWDEFNEILYFTAQTVVLGYDLRSEQVKRIVDNYEHPYDGPGVVSPLGRYLVLITLVQDKFKVSEKSGKRAPL